jgi:phosphoribosylanthranilate isomerase
VKTFVKLSGLTTPETVREVPAGGAAGFVVAAPGAPGNLALEAVPPLIESLSKDAEAWAVTADPPADLIHHLFDEVGVDRVQVYGRIPDGLEFLEIHHLVPSLPIPAAGTSGPEPTVPPAEDYSRLHLDSTADPLRRGSEARPDWEMCARLVDAQPGRKVILAGGLAPETVAEALATVRPWGVDIAAGIRSTDGGADPGRLRSFLLAVEEYERSHP